MMPLKLESPTGQAVDSVRQDLLRTVRLGGNIAQELKNFKLQVLPLQSTARPSAKCPLVRLAGFLGPLESFRQLPAREAFEGSEGTESSRFANASGEEPPSPDDPGIH